jgi:ubiquinone/menaquinone biosynthesis C-methylase UbiE
VDGGYDRGYEACPCFWGRRPGTLVKALESHVSCVAGLCVLDVGCGEGKNAIYFANQGARVKALDISELALGNARRAWATSCDVTWEAADIRSISLPQSDYDIVVAYGLLHCLKTFREITDVVAKLQRATKPGGYHIICSFNDRFQDLSAHPNFEPCLIDHEQYLGFYGRWEILMASDSDLAESHPHNNIRHVHSMTRLIARKPNV